MQSKPRIREVERNLFHKYSRDEYISVSQAASKVALTCSEKKAELDTIRKNMKAEIDALEESVSSSLRKIHAGGEYRDVKCEIHLDQPNPGMATIIRTDTGETVEKRPMTPQELQFNLDEGSGPKVVKLAN